MSKAIRGDAIETALTRTGDERLIDGGAVDGIYSVDGRRLKKSRKPLGVATLVRFTNSRGWFAGSALYKLDPPVHFFEYGRMAETSYVVVATLPPEFIKREALTVFATNGRGSLFGRFAEFNDYISAEIGPRLIGGSKHSTVMLALQGGYVIDNSNGVVQRKKNRSRRMSDHTKPG